MAAGGRSLELYYVDGRPDGMVTAELFNWTGHVLMAPRTQISAALARAEANHAGVYLLLGEGDGGHRAYIGEGEDIGARIRSHDLNKDWWDQAVLISAAANKLNKAHVKYLEARLIEEARLIGRTPLDNATLPTRPSLSEADVAKMETFFSNILDVLPAVRVDLFVRRSRVYLDLPRTNAHETGSPVRPRNEAQARFVLESKKHGLRANAVFQNGELIVQQGSTARASWEGPPSHSYSQLHAELLRSGVLSLSGGLASFVQNYAFSSPSAAAAIIYGRTANGPLAWHKEDNGITYRAWEAQQLL